MKKIMFFRISRLIEIINIVSGNPGWTAKEFAEYFSVSEKRIFDDLRDLNAANIPIVFDRTIGGYRLLKPPKIPTEFILNRMNRAASLGREMVSNN